jgi:hypothetical protein
LVNYHQRKLDRKTLFDIEVWVGQGEGIVDGMSSKYQRHFSKDQTDIPPQRKSRMPSSSWSQLSQYLNTILLYKFPPFEEFGPLG